jgi:hypothetical protein
MGKRILAYIGILVGVILLVWGLTLGITYLQRPIVDAERIVAKGSLQYTEAHVTAITNLYTEYTKTRVRAAAVRESNPELAVAIDAQAIALIVQMRQQSNLLGKSRTPKEVLLLLQTTGR